MNITSNPENGPKHRVFVALPILEPTISELKEMLQDIPGKKIHHSKWHITMEFLGDISEEKLKQLLSIFNKIDLPSAFEVTLQGLGVFPGHRHARVLWLGLEENQTLSTLSQTIKKSLHEAEFILESRSFLPHISLSRFKSAENIYPWLAKKFFPKITCKVEKISIFESFLSNDESKYKELCSRML